MRRLVGFLRDEPIIGILVLFVLFRLPYLLRLPVFNDEAIYLDWGIRELNSKGYLYYSLYDGKPPLLMWIFAIFQHILGNPLLAGRIVSVFAGFATLYGIYLLCLEFFNRKTAVIASLLYILSPLFILYDRQALMESAVGAVGIWSLYYVLKLNRNKTLAGAVMLGFLLGAGIWLKYSAAVFFIAVIACLTHRASTRKSTGTIGYFALSLAVSSIVCLPLLAQGLFWQSLASMSRYTLTLAEIFRLPILLWMRNFAAFLEISLTQVSPVVCIVGVLGVAYFLLRKNESKTVALWAAVSIMAAVLAAKELGPRYLAPYLPALVVVCALAIDGLAEKNMRFAKALLLASFIYAGVLGYLLIANPKGFFSLVGKISRYSQKNEYVTGWEAGWASQDARDYLKTQAGKGTILVALPLMTGNPQSAIMAYFSLAPNIIPFYLHPQIQPGLETYDCLSSGNPIFLISRDRDTGGNNRFFYEVKRFYNPENEHYVGIFKIKESCPDGKTYKIKIMY